MRLREARHADTLILCLVVLLLLVTLRAIHIDVRTTILVTAISPAVCQVVVHDEAAFALSLHAAGLTATMRMMSIERVALVEARLHHEVVLWLLVGVADAHLMIFERRLVLPEACVVHVKSAVRRDHLLTVRVAHERPQLVAVLRPWHRAALEGLQGLTAHSITERALLEMELGRELARLVRASRAQQLVVVAFEGTQSHCTRMTHTTAAHRVATRVDSALTIYRDCSFARAILAIHLLHLHLVRALVNAITVAGSNATASSEVTLRSIRIVGFGSFRIVQTNSFLVMRKQAGHNDTGRVYLHLILVTAEAHVALHATRECITAGAASLLFVKEAFFGHGWLERLVEILFRLSDGVRSHLRRLRLLPHLVARAVERELALVMTAALDASTVVAS